MPPSSKILSYNIQSLTALAYVLVRSIKHTRRHCISLQFLKLHLQRGREKDWSYHRGYVRLVIVHPQKRHHKRDLSDCGTRRFVFPRSVGQLVGLFVAATFR
jgi:hypothetical protein